jgi:hypothetical protein
MGVVHSAAGLVTASLVEGSVVAGLVDGTVARSAGESGLAGFGSVLPNTHHRQEDQTVDSDRLHVQSFFPTH